MNGDTGERSSLRLAIAIGAGVGAAWLATRALRARQAISFTDRVVVVTGGSRGLGLVLARLFADEGARLVLVARDQAELDRAKADLDGRGRAAAFYVCDIRRRPDVRDTVARILERFGAVDVLINNAGVIQVGPLENMTEEDFGNAMATHFWGPLHLALEIVPSMRRRRFGRIVNIASIGGKVAVPHLAPYCASKFALVGLSDALRAELDRDGIAVTTVAPGLMRTGSPSNAEFKGRQASEYAWFKVASSIPGLTIGAQRAARAILDACRHGDPELTITPQARALAMANAVLPGAVARAMTIVSRLLPGPDQAAEGYQNLKGKDVESSSGAPVPAVVTALTDRAAVANNEV